MPEFFSWERDVQKILSIFILPVLADSILAYPDPLNHSIFCGEKVLSPKSVLFRLPRTYVNG